MSARTVTAHSDFERLNPTSHSRALSQNGSGLVRSGLEGPERELVEAFMGQSPAVDSPVSKTGSDI